MFAARSMGYSRVVLSRGAAPSFPGLRVAGGPGSRADLLCSPVSNDLSPGPPWGRPGLDAGASAFVVRPGRMRPLAGLSGCRAGEPELGPITSWSGANHAGSESNLVRILSLVSVDEVMVCCDKPEGVVSVCSDVTVVESEMSVLTFAAGAGQEQQALQTTSRARIDGLFTHRTA